jgi:hypothetical protein
VLRDSSSSADFGECHQAVPNAPMYNDTPSRDEVRNESVVFSLMLYTNNKVSQMNRQFLGIESGSKSRRHVRYHCDVCRRQWENEKLPPLSEEDISDLECDQGIKLEKGSKICPTCRIAFSKTKKLNDAHSKDEVRNESVVLGLMLYKRRFIRTPQKMVMFRGTSPKW